MLAKPVIGGPALVGRLARRWTTLAVRAARMLPMPDVVVVGYLGHSTSTWPGWCSACAG